MNSTIEDCEAIIDYGSLLEILVAQPDGRNGAARDEPGAASDRRPCESDT